MYGVGHSEFWVRSGRGKTLKMVKGCGKILGQSGRAKILGQVMVFARIREVGRREKTLG
jgi:hypothetical protein